MDTDDLSTEAYRGILIEAGEFNSDLTLQFGLLASSCKNEKEYLRKAKKLIKEIRGLDETDLHDMFFGLPPHRDHLLLTLNKILTNIAEVEKIPEDKRHYE